MTKRQKREEKAARAHGRGRGGVRGSYGQQRVRASIGVITEGEKTEQKYLEWLNAKVTDVQIQAFWDDSDPVSVVRRAIRELDAGHDEVWAFVDVDKHARLREALEMASKSRLSVAVSGLCFETWFLMHLAPQTRPFAKPSEEKKAWAAATGGDGRPDEARLMSLDGKLPVALEHAARKRKQDDRNGVDRRDRNPATEVDLFIHAVARLAGVEPGTLYGA